MPLAPLPGMAKAVGVQVIVNGVLGLHPGVNNLDVNGGGAVNAADNQLSINAALGIASETQPKPGFEAFPPAGFAPFTGLSVPGPRPIQAWQRQFRDGNEATVQNPSQVCQP